MTSPDRRATILACALTLALATSGAPAGAARTSELPVRLVSGVQALRIAAVSGDQIDIPLAAGVRFRAVQSAEGGCIAAGVRDESSLVLIRADLSGPSGDPERLHWGEPERMVTPTPGGRYVADPQPLTVGDDLRGMIWLAGDGPRSTAVLFAEWLGDHWGPTEVVSPPGQGTQIALAVTSRDDGSFLALWSAFDGTDDEIVWSRYEDRTWSTPTPLAADNWVPDITPAVTEVGGRPVAVWSHYDDGGYRLVMSRLDGDTWSSPEPFAAIGSLFPRFDRSEDGALLLYRDARSGVWIVLKLDSNLQTRARASIDTGGAVEPAVLSSGPDGLDVVPGPDRPRTTVPWALLP